MVDCINDVNEERITFVEESFEIIIPNGMKFCVIFRIEYGFNDLNNKPTMLVDAWSSDVYEGEVQYDFNLNFRHEYMDTHHVNISHQHYFGQQELILDEDFLLLDGQYFVSGSVNLEILPTKAEIFMHQFKSVS